MRKTQTALLREAFLEGLYLTVEHAEVAEIQKLTMVDLNDLFIVVVKKNDLRLAGILLELSVDLSHCCPQGMPAIHHAVLGNFQPIIQLLIDHSVDLNQKDAKFDTALNKAVRSHMDLQCILLLVTNGASIWLDNVDSQSPAMFLLGHAFDDQFWITVIAHDEACQVLSVMRSPVLFVNRLFKETHQQQSIMANFIQTMLLKQDPQVVRRLLLWHIALDKAAVAHLSERDDILAYANQIKQVIIEIFQCDSMDQIWNIQTVLQPNLSIDRSQPILKYQIHSLREGGLLDLCLHHSCKFIFGDHHISGFVNRMFWLSSRVELSACGNKGVPHPSALESVDLAARCLKVDVMENPLVRISYGMRSCPVVCCLSEALVRTILIVLVAEVSVKEYGNACGTDYTGHCNVTFSGRELILVVLYLSLLLYAAGEMAERKWDLWEYFRDEWNIMDFIGYFLVSFWAYNRASNVSESRVFLAMAAIPLSLGMLRYLTISRTLGVIVSIARSMMFDMLGFIAVYLVCIFGFGIFFQGTFHDSDDFSDSHQTFLTLFQFTIGDFNYGVFDSSSYKMNVIGETVLVFFLILIAVLLLNLLISRMTNAYQRVDDRAMEEWSYNKTRIVQNFLLLQERHPFCMMPPPFNLIPTILTPLHKVYLQSFISVSGTVANVFYGQVGGIVRAVGFCLCALKPVKGVVFSLLFERRDALQAVRYFFSNLFVLLLLFCIILMTAVFPFMIDWWYKPLPCMSFFVEYVKDQVPTYLLLDAICPHQHIADAPVVDQQTNSMHRNR